MGVRRPGLVRAGSRRMLAGPDGETLTVVADPVGTRKSGEWYGWGLDYASPILSSEYGAGIAASPGIPPGGGYPGFMHAIPGWFPEPGTLTAIASVLNGDQGGTRGWVGIARDEIVGTDHFPSATTEVYAAVVGQSTGQRKIRGGVVSLPTRGNEILWWILQDYGGFATGNVWAGVDRRFYLGALGLTVAAGVALDGTITNALGLDGGIGYQTATPVAQTLGRGFPRVDVGVLSSANNGTMWGNVAIPLGIYQWTRAV